MDEFNFCRRGMYSVKVHALDPKRSRDTRDKGDDGASNLRASGGDSVEEEDGSSGETRTVRFSSGNPRFEATRGVVHLFRSTGVDPDSQDALPVGRSEHLCVLAVPNHLNLSDFCQFTGSFLPSITVMRLVRTDGVKDRYCALLTFNSLESADGFYQHHNGKKFSSLEDEVCHILYTADVQFTESEEQASTPPVGQTELPTCPVCLERLDQHISGILTTVCNHSFHSTCISKWKDSSCPVCRYCQQQTDISTCCICGTSESLWICVVCGFVGCGRYQGGHAENHFKLSNHCYAMELETQRVWDYAGDGYVHRLIQSKSDGKVVEFPAPCGEAVDDSGRSCECSQTADFMEAVNLSKMEAVSKLLSTPLSYEYNHLLTTQLESQRQHYEREIVALKQQNALKEDQTVHSRLQKLHEKMDAKLQARDKETKDLNQWIDTLLENQQLLKAQVHEKDEKIARAEAKIADLEEQVRDFMLYIQAEKTIAATNSADLRDGTVLPVRVTETRTTKGRRSAKGNPRNN